MLAIINQACSMKELNLFCGHIVNFFLLEGWGDRMIRRKAHFSEVTDIYYTATTGIKLANRNSDVHWLLLWMKTQLHISYNITDHEIPYSWPPQPGESSNFSNVNTYRYWKQKHNCNGYLPDSNRRMLNRNCFVRVQRRRLMKINISLKFFYSIDGILNK